MTEEERVVQLVNLLCAEAIKGGVVSMDRMVFLVRNAILAAIADERSACLKIAQHWVDTWDKRCDNEVARAADVIVTDIRARRIS